jgi:hypothetical protein
VIVADFLTNTFLFFSWYTYNGLHWSEKGGGENSVVFFGA